MSAFRVKLGANDLNCVDVPLNPTHSLTHAFISYSVNQNTWYVLTLPTSTVLYVFYLLKCVLTFLWLNNWMNEWKPSEYHSRIFSATALSQIERLCVAVCFSQFLRLQPLFKHFEPISLWMIRIRYLTVWHAERWVCWQSSWFSTTSSSTVVSILYREKL